MKEPYDVKITRAGKPVLEFKSNMVAVVGITKSEIKKERRLPET
jgi:hypothetical protein